MTHKVMASDNCHLTLTSDVSEKKLQFFHQLLEVFFYLTYLFIGIFSSPDCLLHERSAASADYCNDQFFRIFIFYRSMGSFIIFFVFDWVLSLLSNYLKNLEAKKIFFLDKEAEIKWKIRKVENYANQ